MNFPATPAAPSVLGRIPDLLRGEVVPIRRVLEQGRASSLLLYAGVIVLGTGSFGAAIGWWRAPEQALYTAIKFPLIVFLTTLGNGLLNGMLAPLLGANLTFRQSLHSIFMSFTIVSAVLGACAPILGFLIWNAPAIGASAGTTQAYDLILLTLVGSIALAGLAGNLRLFQLLRELSGGRGPASRVLTAWLAGNLLLGSQLSWNLRPFVGSPGLPVQFLREHPLDGNFFEALLVLARHLLS